MDIEERERIKRDLLMKTSPSDKTRYGKEYKNMWIERSGSEEPTFYCCLNMKTGQIFKTESLDEAIEYLYSE